MLWQKYNYIANWKQKIIVDTNDLIRILLPYKAKTVMDKVYLFGINLDNVSQKAKL